MNREELIAKIAEEAEISKKAAGLALKAFIDSVTLSLQKDDDAKVTLVGFGTFAVSARKERKGINPKTGEEITIPAKKVPVFKAGKKLKDAVQ